MANLRKNFNICFFCVYRFLFTIYSIWKTKRVKSLIITPTLFIDFNINNKDSFAGGKEKFPLLISEYERIAKEEKVYFLDSNQFIKTSKADGVHLDAENHIKLAIVISIKIKEIYNAN